MLSDCNNVALRTQHLTLKYTAKEDIYRLIVNILFIKKFYLSKYCFKIIDRKCKLT